MSWDRTYRFRNLPRSESRQPQTLKRCASGSPTDVRHNDQFQNCNTGKFNPIFLDLVDCVRGAEIPLLAHNLSKLASPIPRPSQDELLGTFRLGLFEDERDARDSLWLIED